MSGVRDYLEGRKFYWWSLQFNLYPLPWHWQIEYDNHPGWFKFIVGPIGVFVVKPFKESKNESE